MSVSAPGTRKPPVTGWTVTSPCGSSRRTRSRFTDAGSGTPTVTSTSIRPPRSRTSRSEEHTSELQSRGHLVCRLLLEKKKVGLGRRARWNSPGARVRPVAVPPSRSVYVHLRLGRLLTGRHLLNLRFVLRGFLHGSASA